MNNENILALLDMMDKFLRTLGPVSVEQEDARVRMMYVIKHIKERAHTSVPRYTTTEPELEVHAECDKYSTLYSYSYHIKKGHIERKLNFTDQQIKSGYATPLVGRVIDEVNEEWRKTSSDYGTIYTTMSTF